jgi:hypothetical protein
MSYGVLSRDPASLSGQVVTYTGQVFEYDTNTTPSHMIVSVTSLGYGLWKDNVWVDVDPSQTGNICTDTVVQFWGSIVGPYSYTTTNADTTLTIPEVTAKYIVVTASGC